MCEKELEYDFEIRDGICEECDLNLKFFSDRPERSIDYHHGNGDRSKDNKNSLNRRTEKDQ